MMFIKNNLDKLIYALIAFQIIGGAIALIDNYLVYSVAKIEADFLGGSILAFFIIILPVCILLSGILLIFKRRLGIILAGFTYIFQIFHISSAKFNVEYINIGGVFLNIEQSIADGFSVGVNALLGPGFYFSLSGPEEVTNISVNLLALMSIFILEEAWKLTRLSN